MFYIHRLHRDEYNTVLWTNEYGPYETREQAEALAAEFAENYGYECVVHDSDASRLN